MARMEQEGSKNLEDRRDEMQSITLLVDGVAIPIDVPRSEEPYYRRAQHTISALVKKYRAAYPQPAESDEQLHWLMAAVDIAVQCEVLKESQDTTELLNRLSEVNNLLERKL